MENASNKPFSNEGHGFEAIYAGTSQKVSFDGHVESAALGSRTSIVQVSSTQDCHLAFGATPVAVADGTNMFLPKGTVQRIGVAPSTKISAIKDSSAGILYITEGL